MSLLPQFAEQIADETGFMGRNDQVQVYRPVSNDDAPMSDAAIDYAFRIGWQRPASADDIANIRTDADRDGWAKVKTWFKVRPKDFGLPGVPSDFAFAPPPPPPTIKTAPALTRTATPQPVPASMSLIGSIAKVAGGIGGFAIGGPAGAVAGIKGAQAIGSAFSGGGKTQSSLPQLTNPLLRGGGALVGGSIGTAMGGPIGGFVGNTLGSFLPSLLGNNGSSVATRGGCGCSSGRDSCTGQKLTSQPAPRATLFGGCCPPGRVLRRIGMGRDVCIRKPRMNVLNPAALARADRRVRGFANKAAPMLKQMGYQVSKHRKVNVKMGRKRKARR